MSFWDVVWFILISFAFVAYLIVLFAIISDLFRDKKASGVEKALWIVCLIFLPFLTSLVYLLVRGRGMAERAGREVEAAERRRDDQIRKVVGNGTPADEIARARGLLDSGVISNAEYERLKQKALV
jgi:Phospholipase_D-nuclease N-terminal/Short C-terminal domain